MPNVAIVTDSTVNLPQHFIDQYGIHVMPQTLVWDQQTYRDGIDIQPSEFYTRLQTSKSMPTTSQASPAEFSKAYASLLEKGSEILSIVVSSKLSGTYQSANQAKELFPGAAIELIDSETTSMAMGFMVLLVARAAAEGASLKECTELAQRSISKVGVFFVVDTLEFLHRGGRIGGAARFLGTALNLKPILQLRDGRIEAIERVRTQRKAYDRLVELVAEKVSGHQPVRLSNLHANAAEQARAVLERVAAVTHPVETVETEVSPVIGTHAGPGVVGIAYMAGL